MVENVSTRYVRATGVHCACAAYVVGGGDATKEVGVKKRGGTNPGGYNW